MIKPPDHQPPYTITTEILNSVAAISEAIGRLTVLTEHARDLRLRRINRIRTNRRMGSAGSARDADVRFDR